ncbi:MAG: 2-hydroxyacyl-CoA dehydratase [Armatimonadota bacterium]|nr:2-hydroxyacyl-CoA dehydratase [Armatimonadota bacterium]
MKRIGITTTIPVEIVYAAECTPVDLNNVFITSPDPASLVARAELDGYPRTACGWIKGIYATVIQGGYDAIVAVVEGDCSQTQAMVETLASAGVEIIPFAYPYSRDADLLRAQMEKLIDRLGTTWEAALEWKEKLDRVRREVWLLDELTWTRGTVTSYENHYYQVCCSDFNGNPEAFLEEVRAVNQRAMEAEPISHSGRQPLRLGYIGVPPIFTDFYEWTESLGVRIVFNEVQRQFSMPFETDDLVEQYLKYTYPYDIFGRIEDINREVRRRGIVGLIHYTQSFCFRQIQDLIIRRHVDVPILTIEGDAPCPLDARTKVRIESFVEMLSSAHYPTGLGTA